jgi:tetratricopeptide (TPR) repeat protein
MDCPHCGAEVNADLDICPLCGAGIDKAQLRKDVIKKGDAAYKTGNYDMAIIFYKKAFDLNTGGDAELCIKCGNAYDKKDDKQAVEMYLKALSYDFYNERAHNLLILFYDRHNRLKDLENWYEKNRGGADGAFIDRQIRTINGIISFRQKLPAMADEVRQKKAEKMVSSFTAGFKHYIIMNIVLGVIAVLMAVAVAFAIIFKLNMIIVFSIIGFFLVLSVAAIFYLNRRKSKENKGKTLVSIEDIYREYTGKNI